MTGELVAITLTSDTEDCMLCGFRGGLIMSSNAAKHVLEYRKPRLFISAGLVLMAVLASCGMFDRRSEKPGCGANDRETNGAGRQAQRAAQAVRDLGETNPMTLAATRGIVLYCGFVDERKTAVRAAQRAASEDVINARGKQLRPFVLEIISEPDRPTNDLIANAAQQNLKRGARCALRLIDGARTDK